MISSIIGGGISAIGSLIGGGINAQAQNQANETNYQIFKEQQAWQQAENELTRTREDNSVQRRAADLKAAGINQLIAGADGAASSSGGIVAAPQSIPVTGLGDAISGATSQAANVANSIANTKNTQEDKKGKEYNRTVVMPKSIEETEQRIEESIQRIKESNQQIENLIKTGKLTDQQVKNLENENLYTTEKINLTKKQIEKVSEELAGMKMNNNMDYENMRWKINRGLPPKEKIPEDKWLNFIRIIVGETVNIPNSFLNNRSFEEDYRN